MQVWMTVILAVQLLSALAMIGLVLIQHGKGADMGASFGSGASGSLFGATGSANFLSRATAGCATLFFICTLGLAYLSSHNGAAQRNVGGSVLDRPAIAASAPGNGVIPGAAPAPAPASAAVPDAAPVTTSPAVPAPMATPAAAASEATK